MIFAFTLVFSVIGVVSAASADKPRVGLNKFVMHNEWHVDVNNAIKKTVEALGGEIIETNAGGDPSRQARNFETLVARNVDVIVQTLAYPETMKTALKSAEKAGIPVISVEAYLKSPAVETEIAINQIENGITVANEVINWLEGKGSVLVVHASGEYTLDLRYDGFMRKLEEYSDIEVLETLPFNYDNWVESVKSNVESYLSANPDKVDAVYGGNNLTLVGAIRAIESLGMEDEVKVFGCDAYKTIRKMMRADNEVVLSAVTQDANAMGIVAGKAAMKVAKGEDLPRLISLPSFKPVRSNFPPFPENYPEKGPMMMNNSPEWLNELGLGWGPDDPARQLVIKRRD